MLRLPAAALFGLVLAGSGAASAEQCYPVCDYYHDYGPQDFTYVRPGLYGFPRCGPSGDCSPYLVYTYPIRRQGRITIRTRSRIAPPPRS